MNNNSMNRAMQEIQSAAASMGNNSAGFSNFSGPNKQGVVDLKGKSQHTLAQFNIVLSGNLPAACAATGLTAIPVELFYNQNSCTKLGGTALNALIPTGSPIDGTISTIDTSLQSGTGIVNMATFPGFELVGPGTTATAKTFVRGVYGVNAVGNSLINPANWQNPFMIIGFDQNGTLNYIMPTIGAATGYPVMTVSVRETSYRALFEYSGAHSFNINKIRATATAANGGNQFQNIVKWSKATWLGGVQSQPISVQSFVSPFQQLGYIADIVKTPIKIDRQKGILYALNAQEIPGAQFNGAGTVLTCFCDLYSEPKI
jgi:hypothetical protein